MDAPRPPFLPDLTESILARTSGSACGRLREQACDFVDGLLDGPRAQLVEAHLGHCAGCRALVAALRLSARVLPTLAAMDPGPALLPRVLGATSRAPRVVPMEARWLRLLHRPRIALEMAFLGAAACLMAIHLGGAPSFRPPKALAPARLAAPLTATTRRVVQPLLQAERRMAASLRRAFVPRADGRAAGLWQRGRDLVRGWLGLSDPAPTPPQERANP